MGKTSDFGRIASARLNLLLQKFPYVFSLFLNKDAFVADCWCTVSSWNLGLKRNVSDSEFSNVAAILEILHSWAPNGECDSLNWKLNAFGIFTMKSTFLNQRISHYCLPPGEHHLEG